MMRSKLLISRLRFSIRFMLGVVAITALIVVWLMLPTYRARRFTIAINRGDFTRASDLLLNKAGPFPNDWRRCERLEATAILRPITWHDFLNRRRQLDIGVEYVDGDCMVVDAFPLVADRRGVFNVRDLVY